MTNIRVLHIDDDPLYQAQVEDLLGQATGVSFAYKGVSTPAAFWQENLKAYDALLVDLHLGEGVSGIDIVQKAASQGVPIFVFSNDVQAIRQSLRAGARTSSPKPRPKTSLFYV